ncbi:MAG: transcription termination factor Rho [Rubritalea sp.]|jgi:transcription termination factor Rho|tara:strand:+ start:214 stop:2304 length:2091 start_codon:yes stop_codon:yes gene_type:complete
MKSFGLTGGIATGKSTAAKMMQAADSLVVIFDADDYVHQLYQDHDVLLEIRKMFGTESITAEGQLNKTYLREVVFSDEGQKKRLQDLIHPKVRKECLALHEKALHSQRASLFVADIPLLFEGGFDFGQEANLVVAVSRKTQVQRLKMRSGFDDATVYAILAAQLPISHKEKCADVVLWNEGPKTVLEAQVNRFIKQQKIMSEEAQEELNLGKGVNPTEETDKPKEVKKVEETTQPAEKVESEVESKVEASAVVETEQKEGAELEQVAESAKPEEPKYDVPDKLVVNEFREKPLAELHALADSLPIKIQPMAMKSQLVFDVLSFYAKHGTELTGFGFMEQAKDNYAMLRCPKKSFKTSPDDLYIAGDLIKKHGLCVGQKVTVKMRAPRGRDKYLSAMEVLLVEDLEISDYELPEPFDKLTALIPNERIILENGAVGGLGVRLVDLVAPLGKGQRGLIVAPPRGGKTILLKNIAQSIKANHKEVELIVLLLDERPEEVTDFEETVDAEIFSSTFDEPSRRHAQVSDLVLERAKRLVELGKDVVILLDSLTRLARGHNNSQKGGVIGSGGLNPQALQKSRKFFGAARNVEGGGSLTILATALVETESRMDEVIFEEFKGTGNMEIRLDQDLAERRIYPAIHIPQSGTRNDDRLYHPDEMQKVLEVRRVIAALPVGDALQTLLKALSNTQNNTELLLKGI